MIVRFLLAAILGLISFDSIAHADHLPETFQARGQPEKRLAGVDLSRFKLADIIRLYGQPRTVKAWEQDNPKIANSYDYYWRKRGVNLKVVIHRVSGLEYIGLVEIAGLGRRGKIAGTAAGLRLGDPLKDLVRIYGQRFKVRNIPESRIHDVIIQWRREEYSLVVSLNRRNRITGLTLAAPE